MKNKIIASVLVLVLSACADAAEHRASVANQDKDRISVGTVQREIRVGMTSADVVEVLGSPNIVATDDQRRESWVYDKISIEKVYSTSSGGLGLLFGAAAPIGSAAVGGGAGGSYSSSAGAASTTQRTLTIIVKFDNAGKVRDYSYRSSSF